MAKKEWYICRGGGRMKEYITKDRAKQFVCGHCNEVCSEEPCEPSDCDWMAFIDKEPAADVVEVVRCKDCKYSGMYCFGTSKEETLACLETEEDGFIRFATSVKADDYCSRGERKMNKEAADDKEQPEEAPGK